MKVLEKLETQLDVWLNKKAPFRLPEEGRKALARALWWIVLLVGIVQLWGAWVMWHLGHAAERTAKEYISQVYGAPADTIDLGLFYWASFFCISLVAVLMLVASPKLKQMRKGGWNLLYYAMLLNAVFALVRLFSGVEGIVSGFLSAIVGTVVGGFLLFQTRDYFTGHHTSRTPVDQQPKK